MVDDRNITTTQVRSTYTINNKPNFSRIYSYNVVHIKYKRMDKRMKCFYPFLHLFPQYYLYIIVGSDPFIFYFLLVLLSILFIYFDIDLYHFLFSLLIYISYIYVYIYITVDKLVLVGVHNKKAHHNQNTQYRSVDYRSHKAHTMPSILNKRSHSLTSLHSRIAMS